MPGVISRLGLATGGGDSPGEPEQVVALVGGEHQRPGQRGQHLPRRVRAAGLLQPDVVVDRHAGQLGHLLAAQPRRAPAPAPGRGQADLARAQPGSPGPQERGQLGAVGRVHVSRVSLAARRPREGGTADPRLGGSLPLPRAPPSVGGHDDDDRPDHRGQQGNRLRDRPAARRARHYRAGRRAGRGAGPGRPSARCAAGGADARFVPLDVTDAKSVRRGRRLDRARVRPAGRPGQQRRHRPRAGPPSQTDLDAMREVYETNVFGVVSGDQRDAAAAAPRPGRADRQRVQRGRLDHLDDRPGQPAGPDAGRVPYPSSKSRAQHGHRHVRQGTAGHPDQGQRGQPGLHATDLNGNSGFRSVTEGAEASVHLATLPADGPSGKLWGHLWTADGPDDAYGRIPW